MKEAWAGWMILAMVAGAFPVQSQDASTPGIVDQRDYPKSINGCAPASILNLLKFSGSDYRDIYDGLVADGDGDRMRLIVDRYFRNRKSVVYPTVNRWGAHGLFTADLAVGLNEMMAEHGLPELRARYLDRKEEESGEDHLFRCREWIADSLANGVTPILSLRSFVVKHREESDGEPRWETARHHYVVVKELKEPYSKVGFEVAAMDSWKGQLVDLYIHVEGNAQPFRALKGTMDSGEWLGGQPFLQVVAPQVSSVLPRNLEWSERFIVAANFLIGDF